MGLLGHVSGGTHQAPPAYHHVNAVAAGQLCRWLATQLALKGAAIILLHLQLTSALRQTGWKESNQQQLQAKLYSCICRLDNDQLLQPLWQGGLAPGLGCFPNANDGVSIPPSHNRLV